MTTTAIQGRFAYQAWQILALLLVIAIVLAIVQQVTASMGETRQLTASEEVAFLTQDRCSAGGEFHPAITEQAATVMAEEVTLIERQGALRADVFMRSPGGEEKRMWTTADRC